MNWLIDNRVQITIVITHTIIKYDLALVSSLYHCSAGE